MRKISNLFSEEAQRYQELAQDIASQVDNLIGNGFKGLAAHRFHEEMESGVLPGMRRLSDALDEGAHALDQIARIFDTAEQQAASLFNKGTPPGGNGGTARSSDLASEHTRPEAGSGSGQIGNWEVIRGPADTYLHRISETLKLFGRFKGDSDISHLGSGISFVSDIVFGEDPNIARRITAAAGKFGGSMAISSNPYGAAAMLVNSGVQLVGWSDYQLGNIRYGLQFGDDPAILENLLAFQNQKYENIQRMSLSPLLKDIGSLYFDSMTGGKDFMEIPRVFLDNPGISSFFNSTGQAFDFGLRLANPIYGSVKTGLESISNPGIHQRLWEDAGAIGIDAGNVVVGLANYPVTEVKRGIMDFSGGFQDTISRFPFPNSWKDGVSGFVDKFQDNVVQFPDLYDNWLPRQRAY
ncbi:MAG: WXG100 family type VII secretion target [Anaerolineaceae bacterium]|nr:WXG100 family type VII secretion target [Anaerolineaceae bacterium]